MTALAKAAIAAALSLLLAGASTGASVAAPPPPPVPNPGFEEVDAATGFARGWIRGMGEGTQGSAEVDLSVARSGSHSLRITNATPHQAYRYVLVNTLWLRLQPETTYLLRFHARGEGVGRCFAGVAIEGAGESRLALPAGDYPWRELAFRFTTPPGSGRVNVQFLADGLTRGLWIDDVSIERSPVQLANIRERRAPPGWTDWYPRTPGPMPRRLAVLDVSREGPDVAGLMTALQGIVNRQAPRLYLINPTNPARYDEMWLAYLRERGYTGPEERLASPEEALERFRGSVRGAVVWDPELPGSRHAAWMLAGLENLLPASPETAARFRLPVVEDLRGRWTRNVDAYRWVFGRHWPRMSHTLLAWDHPENPALSSRDVMVQQRVFLFWISSPLDGERGADPVAEHEFVEELLAATPGNVPVMGWPMHGTRGVDEFAGVRLLSEYGKWVPGTAFNSNGTVHSAVRPEPGVFRQRDAPGAARTPALERDRVYLAVSILDSGDAHWYWQFFQRGIWADPARGRTPTGFAMNMTLVDALPAVAEWYYRNRKPRDTFFGFLYMNAPVFAARFRRQDRERIWAEFVRRTAAYLQRLDMEGLELYTGGTADPPASRTLLRRFTRGIPGLRYLLVGLGRHAGLQPDAAAEIVDGVAVFHTLTDFRVWTTGADLAARTMDGENTWLAAEIVANTPTRRPGFMSAMAVSWSYFPAWLVDLRARLPAHYVAVNPAELARLYRQSLARAAPPGRSGAGAPAGTAPPRNRGRR